MLFVGAVLLALFVLKGPLGLVVVGLAAIVEIGETFFWIHLSRRRRIRAGGARRVPSRARPSALSAVRASPSL
jgi:hypothetical protein